MRHQEYVGRLFVAAVARFEPPGHRKRIRHSLAQFGEQGVVEFQAIPFGCYFRNFTGFRIENNRLCKTVTAQTPLA